jgi:hypothetical protein
MTTTVATIDVGGTGANSAPAALTALGAANVAAYAAANNAYTQANNARAAANSSGLVHPFLLAGL